MNPAYGWEMYGMPVMKLPVPGIGRGGADSDEYSVP